MMGSRDTAAQRPTPATGVSTSRAGIRNRERMMAADWYFRVMGADFGPISGPDLVRQVAEGRIGRDTMVRRGNGAWVPAERISGLFDRAGQGKPGAGPSGPPPDPDEDEGEDEEQAEVDEGPSVFVPAPKPSSIGSSSCDAQEVIDSAEGDGVKVEILAYTRLGGARDYQTAATVYFANQAGIRLKQVRITLRGGEAVAESGTLHFMLGRVEMESKVGGVSGLGKAVMNKFVA